MTERRSTLYVLVAAVAYSLAVWWPTRTLPYHWDGADFVVDATRELLARHLTPLALGHSDFAHPPLFHLSLAAAWTVFGESRLVSHLVVFPFLPLLLVSTYVAGRSVGDRATGVAATAIVATVPVVVAEYGDIYVDLPVGALATAGLAAWLSGRRALAGVFFCAVAGIKEAPLVVPACLAILLARDADRRRDLRAWAALAAPFAVEGAWLVYHHAVTGWWLTRPGFVTAPRRLLLEAGELASELGLEQGRWALVVLAAGSFAIVWRRRPGAIRALAPLLPLVAVLVATFAFFLYAGIFGMRYAIFALPSLAILGARVTREAMPRDALFRPAAALPVVLGVLAWHPTRPMTDGYVFRPEDDLGYLDKIAVGRDAAEWVETHHADAQVYGAFPESYQLTEPWQGYVSRPIEFAPCSAFAPDPTRRQLVYVHGYSPGQIRCKRITDTIPARAIKRFVKNGTWIEIWSITRPKRAS